MTTFAIILCGFCILLFMIIGFLMDEVDKWKRISANYKKSYEISKEQMRKTYKSIERICGACGLTHVDWRDTDGLK